MVELHFLPGEMKACKKNSTTIWKRFQEENERRATFFYPAKSGRVPVEGKWIR